MTRTFKTAEDGVVEERRVAEHETKARVAHAEAEVHEAEQRSYQGRS